MVLRSSRKDEFVWEQLSCWLYATEAPLSRSSSLLILPQPPSFQASSFILLLGSIPAISNGPFLSQALTGCFSSSPLSRCVLQTHQPRVSGCFLFHARAIPTGPQPNESFPSRYGEKITFRVRREQWMQHGAARLPSPLCAEARHSLCTHVQLTGHTRTQTSRERGWCCVSLSYKQLLRLHEATNLIKMVFNQTNTWISDVLSSSTVFSMLSLPWKQIWTCV